MQALAGMVAWLCSASAIAGPPASLLGDYAFARLDGTPARTEGDESASEAFALEPMVPYRIVADEAETWLVVEAVDGARGWVRAEHVHRWPSRHLLVDRSPGPLQVFGSFGDVGARLEGALQPIHLEAPAQGFAALPVLDVRSAAGTEAYRVLVPEALDAGVMSLPAVLPIDGDSNGELALPEGGAGPAEGRPPTWKVTPVWLVKRRTQADAIGLPTGSVEALAEAVGALERRARLARSASQCQAVVEEVAALSRAVVDGGPGGADLPRTHRAWLAQRVHDGQSVSLLGASELGALDAGACEELAARLRALADRLPGPLVAGWPLQSVGPHLVP